MSTRKRKNEEEELVALHAEIDEELRPGVVGGVEADLAEVRRVDVGQEHLRVERLALHVPDAVA